MSLLRAVASWWRRRRSHRGLYAVECAWCRLYRPACEPNITGWSYQPGSHGCCPECRLRSRVEAAADPAQELQR